MGWAFHQTPRCNSLAITARYGDLRGCMEELHTSWRLFRCYYSRSLVINVDPIHVFIPSNSKHSRSGREAEARQQSRLILNLPRQRVLLCSALLCSALLCSASAFTVAG
ncbi:plasma membrane proteolipid 3 [Histoplasma ohiense]|nr:plasma membrane proteolipid 3 [Histoplasma ohiense (nom. inval.)]